MDCSADSGHWEKVKCTGVLANDSQRMLQDQGERGEGDRKENGAKGGGGGLPLTARFPLPIKTRRVGEEGQRSGEE